MTIGVGEYIIAPVAFNESTSKSNEDLPTWEESPNAIVINVADPAVIADATLHLIYNPEIAKHIGRNARASVLEQFSIQRQMDQYQALYEAVYIANRDS